MIGKTISHYRILGHIGVGGMGIVYKAEDTRLRRTVALKFLPPEFTRDRQAKDRFIQEAQAASSLQHVNICVVHDIDETPDMQLFICMEYLEGETLEKKIEQGPLKIEQALDIAIQVARGMAEAHGHNIIHRDIKPANVVITNQGVAKIVDFGLAKLTGRTELTTPGMTLGTVAYMSPEQASGGRVDERADVWSLGAILYEMITGQRPFVGEYENAIVYSLLNAQPEPLTALRTAVPMELERIVMKCLSKDPRERYQHMDELLVDFLSCMKATSQHPAAPDHVTKPRRRVGRLLAYAGAGLIALALIAYILVPHRGPSSPRIIKIAVLPFENLGPAEDEYFTDGLTDEITTRLSSIRRLGVISRTSAKQYKKSSKTLPIVGKELGVDYILEGTIRWDRSGNKQRIRISPELIQISGDVHLWADNFDRTLDDIFAIQTEIATQVVKSLDIVLGEKESKDINAIPTTNVEAYQAYLRALSFSDRIELPNTEMAVEMFGRAVELDSTFALAYAELAIEHLHRYWFGFDHTPHGLATAKEYLDRAFALQSELPEAYLALGYYYMFGFREFDKALDAFDAAERLSPNSSRAREAIAYIWRRQGKFEAAAEQLKQLFELDPQNATLPVEIGSTLRMLGRYAEAETYLDLSISLLPDQSDPYLWKSAIDLLWHGDTKKSRSNLARVPTQYEPWLRFTWLDIYDRNYPAALDRVNRAPGSTYEDHLSVVPVSMLRGMIFRFMNDPVRSIASYDSARASLESAVQKAPDDYRLHESLGIVYAGLGRRDDAVREAELSVSQLPVSRDAWAGVYPVISLAQVYTMLGMNDAAIDKLEYLLSFHGAKEVTPQILRLDPIHDPLRDNPRFQALLTKYGSP